MMRLTARLCLSALALMGLPSVASAAFYGAIAFSDSTGDYGYAFNYRSMEASSQRAIRECMKHSAAKDCVVIKGVGSSRGGPELCAALTVLALPMKKNNGEASVLRWRTVETAPTRDEAEEKSRTGCQDLRKKLAGDKADSPDAPQCQLIAAVCSRGRGQ